MSETDHYVTICALEAGWSTFPERFFVAPLEDKDVVCSLGRGGLAPNKIDAVVLSHLHWDYIGTLKDFETSKFIIGAGGLFLLEGSQGAGSHNKFEPDLLPLRRTVEDPIPEGNTTREAAPSSDGQ